MWRSHLIGPRMTSWRHRLFQVELLLFIRTEPPRQARTCTEMHLIHIQPANSPRSCIQTFVRTPNCNIHSPLRQLMSNRSDRVTEIKRNPHTTLTHSIRQALHIYSISTRV